MTEDEWEAEARWDWQEDHIFLWKTENHPNEFNCSTIAWIIEHGVYPKNIIHIYNTTEYQTNETYQWKTNWNPNTKEVYDDYFFTKCLTKYGDLK